MSRIQSITAYPFHVSAKTNWFFVCIETECGTQAWGEASLNGWETLLAAAVELKTPELLGLTPDVASQRLHVSASDPGGLVVSAAISALQQALQTLQARLQQQPLHALLGGAQRRTVPVYANINRATTERSPAGFAQTAQRAMAQGHTAFKAAPFDGVTPANCRTPEGQALIAQGIERLAAIRDVVGPHARLMVDCHWRFDEAGALQLLQAVAPLQLHWLECPISEAPMHWPALQRLRAACRDAGVLMAAAETQVGLRAFAGLFEAGLYDVVMPDVKYCGGPREIVDIAALAQPHGVQWAPHNPTGPICTLVSLHCAAAAPQCHMLELQFDESPLSEALLDAPHPTVHAGHMAVPDGTGLGWGLRREVLQAHPYQRVPFGIESLMGT